MEWSIIIAFWWNKNQSELSITEDWSGSTYLCLSMGQFCCYLLYIFVWLAWDTSQSRQSVFTSGIYMQSTVLSDRREALTLLSLLLTTIYLLRPDEWTSDWWRWYFLLLDRIGLLSRTDFGVKQQFPFPTDTKTTYLTPIYRLLDCCLQFKEKD